MTVDTDAMGGGIADAGTGTVAVTIVNHKGNVLPETGGIGTTLFYTFGGFLAAFATIMLVTKKRMAF
jgi:LPXTG-motif cell wall-anchored protein